MILLLFTISSLLLISIILVRKSLWVSVKDANNITFQQSFFCWFTMADINNTTAGKNWVYALNNLTNAVIMFCFVVMLICVVLTGIGMLS